MTVKAMTIIILGALLGTTAQADDSVPRFETLYVADLQAALVVHAVCKTKYVEKCDAEGDVHKHTGPFCVDETEELIRAAKKVNEYLRSLTRKELEEERAKKIGMDDLLTYALGGHPAHYPLSEEIIKEMGL